MAAELTKQIVCGDVMQEEWSCNEKDVKTKIVLNSNNELKYSFVILQSTNHLPTGN